MFGLGSVSVKKKDSKSKELVDESDRLRQDAFSAAGKALLTASGVPGTADALSFEPVQGLVAISTSDGKVKLFGRPGCEATLYSAARYPYATRQLQFLRNRGVLVRVSKGGFMECWSVAAGGHSSGGVRSLGMVKVNGDKICCVADMTRDPYVLLGCSSGSLRIAMLVDSGGNPTTNPRHARGFALAPYRVRPSDLRSEGEVRQLAVQSFGPVHRALVLFTSGVVCVWDFRAQQLLANIDPNPLAAATTTPPALATAGEATAVCWIGTDRGDFASGHVDGSVLVWALSGLGPGEAAVAAVLRVFDGTAEPIRMIRCVFGEVDGLLVLGGQEVTQPEGLTWLQLPGASNAAEGPEDQEEEESQEEDDEEEDDDSEPEVEFVGQESTGRGGRARRRRRRRVQINTRSAAPVKLPWFGSLIGFCLVVDGGTVTGYESPTGVFQLVEGGQLVLYDLASEQPHMVVPYFQQRSPITVTDAPLLPLRRPAKCNPNTLSLAALRQVAKDLGGEQGGVDLPGMSPFNCGTAAAPPTDATWGLVYTTGYKDGSVCLWDLHGGTTRLLCAAPAGEAVEAVRWPEGGAVTCLSLVWSTGLLVAGHHKGEVRVYQFSATERQASCVTLESINTPGDTMQLHQPPGLQLRLRVCVNSGEITSLAYCQSIRAIAAGDSAGGIALIDTARPVVRWYAMPGQQAVLACAVAPLPLPAPKARTSEVEGAEGAPSHAVVLADSEGHLAALDANRGCFIGRNGELVPKNHSYSLMLELLDEGFMPLWARRQVGAGCDQSELGSAAGAAASGRGSAHKQSAAGGRPLSRDSESDSEGDQGPGVRAGGGRSAAGRERHRAPAGPVDSDGEDDDDEEEEIEIDEDVDVETLLAKAAAMHMGHPQTEPHRRSSTRSRPRDPHKRSSAAAEEDTEDAGAQAPVLSTCPDPTAHYVLLVTDQYLRLYTTSHVVMAERATLAKRSPAAQQHFVYARPVQVAGAPGVLTLAATEHGLCVQVYSLPSLALVHEAPLSASVSWFWDVPPGHMRRLGRLAATSRLGHLMLLGLSNELLTLGLAAGLSAPAPPVSLFDPTAAAASLAAASEYEEQHTAKLGRLQRRSAQQPGAPGGPERGADGLTPTTSEPLEGVDSPMARLEGRRGDSRPSQTASTGPWVGAEQAAEKVATANVMLTRVFTKVQQGLTRAVDQTTRGVKQLATNVGAALIDGGVGGYAAGGGGQLSRTEGRSAEWYAALPDLGAVFSRTVPEDDSTRQRHKQLAQQDRTGGRDDDEDDDDDDDVSFVKVSDSDEEAEYGGRTVGTSFSAAGRQQGQHTYDPAAVRITQAPAPRKSSAHRPPTPPLSGQQQQSQNAAGRRSGAGDEAAMRNDLFGGARPYQSSSGGATWSAAPRTSTTSSSTTASISQPRTRTAEEIRRAYGKAPADGGRAAAATSRSNEVRSVMEENRSRLEMRGEKLRQLNDKTADLESTAAGFAEMAKQLAERKRNKKWWQL